MGYDREEIVKQYPHLKPWRKKIALVGFARTSRHLAPYDDPEWEIWSLNEAHRQPWLKRATRFFQLHKKWDFFKGGNISYEEHRKWLRKKQELPIYMQADFSDEVPSCVEYPLDEITSTFLYNVRRGGEINEYYTSSFAYMCALACYEAYVYGDIEEIGFWGWEMSTMTEFAYQKGSTEYWLGIATGMGLKITMPKGTQVLYGAKYAWEADRMINRQRLEYYKAVYNAKRNKALGQFQQLHGKRELLEEMAKEADEDERALYEDRLRDMFQKELRMQGVANVNQGFVNAFDMLIGVCDMKEKGQDTWEGPEDDKQATGDIDYGEGEEDGDYVHVDPTDVELPAVEMEF